MLAFCISLTIFIEIWRGDMSHFPKNLNSKPHKHMNTVRNECNFHSNPFGTTLKYIYILRVFFHFFFSLFTPATSLYVRMSNTTRKKKRRILFLALFFVECHFFSFPPKPERLVVFIFDIHSHSLKWRFVLCMSMWISSNNSVEWCDEQAAVQWYCFDNTSECVHLSWALFLSKVRQQRYTVCDTRLAASMWLLWLLRFVYL